MLWPEFIDILKDAKKRKEPTGQIAGAISTLLFSGAMDSLLPEESPKTIQNYSALFEEVKNALKSKASLPKRKKTQAIGLDEVDGPAALALWRSQISPLADIDLVSIVKNNLSTIGFENFTHQTFLLRRQPSGNMPPILLAKRWSDVVSNKTYVDFFSKDKYYFAIVGIVTEAEVKKYADGQKERLALKIFTGSDFSAEICAWPDKKTGKLTPSFAKIQGSQIGIFIMRTNVWNGRVGASLINFHRFFL